VLDDEVRDELILRREFNICSHDAFENEPLRNIHMMRRILSEELKQQAEQNRASGKKKS
jgi:hypothetical protein